MLSERKVLQQLLIVITGQSCGEGGRSSKRDLLSWLAGVLDFSSCHGFERNRTGLCIWFVALHSSFYASAIARSAPAFASFPRVSFQASLIPGKFYAPVVYLNKQTLFLGLCPALGAKSWEVEELAYSLCWAWDAHNENALMHTPPSFLFTSGHQSF